MFSFFVYFDGLAIRRMCDGNNACRCEAVELSRGRRCLSNNIFYHHRLTCMKILHFGAIGSNLLALQIHTSQISGNENFVFSPTVLLGHLQDRKRHIFQIYPIGFSTCISRTV